MLWFIVMISVFIMVWYQFESGPQSGHRDSRKVLWVLIGDPGLVDGVSQETWPAWLTRVRDEFRVRGQGGEDLRAEEN